jgi:hypothetical protein
MPKPSAASLSTPTAALATIRQRPQPPSHLSPEAAAVWDSITAGRPAEFFDRGALPLLEALCVATAEHRRLLAQLERTDLDTDLDRYCKLTRLADAHAGRIGTLATKLRLSKQSTTDSRAGGRAAGADGRTSLERMREHYLGSAS